MNFNFGACNSYQLNGWYRAIDGYDNGSKRNIYILALYNIRACYMFMLLERALYQTSIYLPKTTMHVYKDAHLLFFTNMLFQSTLC